MDAKYYATQVVKKLVDAGYVAYFAGGWVRDYIMGHPSDDIDIATSAAPEKILDLFPRTILVGLAFGVVIVVVEGHQFEVATFRRDLGYESGRRPTGIELANPEEDALRRDFTINGMFFDPIEERIIDYVGGKEDIQKKRIRTIGNPDERFMEDRLRMIRAVRFAARFGFTIDEETQTGIVLNADTLFPAVAMERVWQEFNKMTAYPGADLALVELHRLKLLQVIFPTLNLVHLNDIKHRVSVFPQFPKSCQAILFIMELFPEASLDEQLTICRYLKVSVKEMALVEFMFKFREKINEELLRLNGVDLAEWGFFYAHPHSQNCLDIVSARLSPDIRLSLLKTHIERKTYLHPHIERIVDKKPLVTAALLQSEGIQPGKKMGLLLKEAEKMAMNHNLHDPLAIIEKLKLSHLWTEK